MKTDGMVHLVPSSIKNTGECIQKNNARHKTR